MIPISRRCLNALGIEVHDNGGVLSVFYPPHILGLRFSAQPDLYGATPTSTSVVKAAGNEHQLDLNSAFNRWIEHKDDISPASSRRYRELYRLHIQKRLGSRSAESIQKKDIEDVLKVHSDAGRKSGRLLRTIFNAIMKDGGGTT